MASSTNTLVSFPPQILASAVEEQARLDMSRRAFPRGSPPPAVYRVAVASAARVASSPAGWPFSFE